MPNYHYACEKCEFVREIRHSINQNPLVKCGNCNTELKRTIFAGQATMEGFDFPGKVHKEKKYREKRSREIGKKSVLSHRDGMPALVPNVDGEVCDNWDQAKKLAKDKGLDVSQYDAKVSSLKKQEAEIDEKHKKMLHGEDVKID